MKVLVKNPSALTQIKSWADLRKCFKERLPNSEEMGINTRFIYVDNNTKKEIEIALHISDSYSYRAYLDSNKMFNSFFFLKDKQAFIEVDDDNKKSYNLNQICDFMLTKGIDLRRVGDAIELRVKGHEDTSNTLHVVVVMSNSCYTTFRELAKFNNKPKTICLEGAFSFIDDEMKFYEFKGKDGIWYSVDDMETL